MSASTVMTVRIDPDLLAALRLRARREGRSVSAEVVSLIRREVGPSVPSRKRRTMGMFPSFDAPTLADLLRVRRKLSARIRAKHRVTG